MKFNDLCSLAENSQPSKLVTHPLDGIVSKLQKRVEGMLESYKSSMSEDDGTVVERSGSGAEFYTSGGDRYSLYLKTDKGGNHFIEENHNGEISTEKL